MKTILEGVPLEISNRHLHLCEKDFKILFGENESLKVLKYLSQPGQFAAKETVTLKYKENLIERVRIIGPLRKETQIEISQSDAINKLNIDKEIPRRDSGDLENSCEITIIGPKGKVELKQGLILAKRHLHISEEEANELNLNQGDKISLKTKDNKIMDDITVRVNSMYELAIQIDIDEGLELGINKYSPLDKTKHFEKEINNKKYEINVSPSLYVSIYKN